MIKMSGLVFCSLTLFSPISVASEKNNTDVITRWEVQIPTEWLGKAPLCKAAPKHCVESGRVYLTSDYSGDGSECWWQFGYEPKVLCGGAPFEQSADTLGPTWIGDGPWCKETPKSCTDAGKFFLAYGSAGDAGRRCLTGWKVLCGDANWSYTSPPLKDVLPTMREWHQPQECPLELVGANPAKPREYLDSLKVTIDGGLIYDAADKLFSSLNPRDRRIAALCTKGVETLYVLSEPDTDAPYGSLYLVNICKDSRNVPYYKENAAFPSLRTIAETSKCDQEIPPYKLRIVHSTILGTYNPRSTRTVTGRVAGAGTIEVKDGKVLGIDNCSGHFKPGFEMLLSTVASLQKRHVAVPRVIACKPK